MMFTYKTIRSQYTLLFFVNSNTVGVNIVLWIRWPNCTYLRTCMYVGVCVMCVCTYVYLYHKCLFVYVRVWDTKLHIFVCMYVHMYIWMYMWFCGQEAQSSFTKITPTQYSDVMWHHWSLCVHVYVLLKARLAHCSCPAWKARDSEHCSHGREGAPSHRN